MTSALEKVARALARAHAEQHAEDIAKVDLAKFEDDCWRQFEVRARAALNALKNPDEGTVEAMIQCVHQSGCVNITDFDSSDAGNAFNAAINHIIKEGEG